MSKILENFIITLLIATCNNSSVSRKCSGIVWHYSSKEQTVKFENQQFTNRSKTVEKCGKCEYVCYASLCSAIIY